MVKIYARIYKFLIFHYLGKKDRDPSGARNGATWFFHARIAPLMRLRFWLRINPSILWAVE
jgi:hypothetical protein